MTCDSCNGSGLISDREVCATCNGIGHDGNGFSEKIEAVEPEKPKKKRTVKKK